MINKNDKNQIRKKRHLRIRKSIIGTNIRPRLNVYRSSNNIYAQIINDEIGETIVAASTLDTVLTDQVKHGGNRDAAKIVGKLIAERAIEKGVTEVVFDRGGYIFHGRIKELADAAREAGLKF